MVLGTGIPGVIVLFVFEVVRADKRNDLIESSQHKRTAVCQIHRLRTPIVFPVTVIHRLASTSY